MEQGNEEIQQEENLLESAQKQVSQEQKKKRELLFEMSLFFILGILIGITLKTEAVKRITIGFNDYQLPKVAASYNIAEIKNKLEAQTAQQQTQAQSQAQIQTQAGQAQN
jgi:hypothetical protein